ncbi:MAG: hypothetical protein FJX29_15105, partial [Alphaproteobacteria bacterium]|nr:hypothetical protein [Alphaproteobacteria bacterium]
MIAGDQHPGTLRNASRPARLTKRADFLRAAKGARFYSRSLGVQFSGQLRQSSEPARFGFTVTKRIGGSVERNRIRRRLREALRLASQTNTHSNPPSIATLDAQPGGDYVIVAKREAIATPFGALVDELKRAVRKANERAAQGPAASKKMADQTTVE